MRLYLDDNTARPLLTTLLRKAGHDVVIPADVGTAGLSDPRHLTYAVQHDRVLLTHDHHDFDDLHRLVQATGGSHAGILVVRLDNDPKRDMKDADIVRAIAKLEASGVPIANELHVLNHWR